jgi:transmembrane sensor
MSASDLNPIDAEAAAWAVKLDRPLPDVERAALETWLTQDRRHRGALARAQAA